MMMMMKTTSTRRRLRVIERIRLRLNVEEIASRKKETDTRMKDRIQRRSKCKRGRRNRPKPNSDELLSLAVLDRFGVIYYKIESGNCCEHRGVVDGKRSLIQTGQIPIITWTSTRVHVRLLKSRVVGLVATALYER
jgi:hypothetical protein